MHLPSTIMRDIASLAQKAHVPDRPIWTDSIASTSRTWSYIQSLKAHWHAMYVPEPWKRANPNAMWLQVSPEDTIFAAQKLVLIESATTSLSYEECLRRAIDDPTFPDFGLARDPVRMDVYVTYEPWNWRYSRYQMATIVSCPSDIRDLQAVLTVSLARIPGTYAQETSKDNFTTSLSVGIPGVRHSPVTISLIFPPIVPTLETSLLQALRTPCATLLYPALLVGASIEDCKSTDADLEEQDCRLREAMSSISRAAEQSLASLLIAWLLRSEQDLPPPDFHHPLPGEERELPEWGFLLGLVYDLQHVHIIAHIPFRTAIDSEYQYASVIVDTLPLLDDEAETTDPFQFYLARYKLALAMIVIQRHLFRLIGIWEKVVWPTELVDEEICARRQRTGLETPSYSQPDLNDDPEMLAQEAELMDRLFGHALWMDAQSRFPPSDTMERYTKHAEENRPRIEAWLSSIDLNSSREVCTGEPGAVR